MFSISKKIAVLLSCVVLSLSLCGCTEKVEFSGGKLGVDASELTMVLQPGETALLDRLTALTYADLSGSTAYDEIFRWAQAHPQVDVRYTLTFPDGTVADSKTKTLDLSALAPDDVEAAASLLPYLAELEELVLMPGDFSPAQVKLLSEAAGLDVDYSYSLCGQTVELNAKGLDLSAMTDADVPAVIELLGRLPGISRVNLGAEQAGRLSWDSIYQLVQSCPDVDFAYSFTLYGKPCSFYDTVIDLNHMPLGDSGAQVFQAARCMKNLEYLDMDSCGISNEVMEQIRAGLPGVKVVWRIWFGEAYSVRTDVEKILASKPSVGGLLSDRDVQVLKYCTDVKYLDLGHNMFLTDISFVNYMPELEVFVMAMNDVSDISPLANCPKLEYLEIQTNPNIGDLSPLANCRELAHLNVVQCLYVYDLSPLFGLEKLERFWLGSGNMVPPEQIELFRQHNPDCELNAFSFNDPTDSGWRVVDMNIDSWMPIYSDRYELLTEQFGYLEEDYSFAWLDPKY